MKDNIRYILPREAQELIFKSGLGDFYFYTDFKKFKFRHKGFAIRYEYDEVKDWVEEKHLEILIKNKDYANALIEYKSLADRAFWA